MKKIPILIIALSFMVVGFQNCYANVNHIGDENRPHNPLVLDQDGDGIAQGWHLMEHHDNELEVPEGPWRNLFEQISAAEDLDDEDENEEVIQLSQQLVDEYGNSILEAGDPLLHLHYCNVLWSLADQYTETQDEEDHFSMALQHYLTIAILGLTHTSDDDQHMANVHSSLECAQILRLGGDDHELDVDLSQDTLASILLNEVNVLAMGNSTSDPLIITPIERVPFLGIGQSVCLLLAELEKESDLWSSLFSLCSDLYKEEKEGALKYHQESVDALANALIR